jgi:hypothetical protein
MSNSHWFFGENLAVLEGLKYRQLSDSECLKNRAVVFIKESQVWPQH